jgi:hypothetical protein
MVREWQSFLVSADQWIINYSLPAPHLMSVKLFSAGHALELYLKASYAKITGDIDAAMAFGHNLVKMWNASKSLDPSFIPRHELRAAVLALNILDPDEYRTLPEDDLLHFLDHQELYVVAKHLPDLKYIGARPKTIKGDYLIVCAFPNPIWIPLFRDLRSFLNYPESRAKDPIAEAIQGGELPASCIAYLSPLMGEC